ncbi:sugar ABC transporter ATP-binding protein [Allorhizobium taibaishanense]|uniref:Sugar ABC transporter n=1 Tax=Allorhizobium taibaishanense TaxID=887144 RepID=A0A1Q9A7I2_9HYPH|nr:sugar ABC transporter ATP-binding protein [Allorhizobium taibaishanense]OLP50548.1 sugar ABC transporter [Allorhizobium taibaishanense]
MNEFCGQPTTGASVLRMTGIVKTFGGARALDGAALEVGRGSVHGLVGQNGAGKSTLIKILAGLYQPDEGIIEICGTPQDRLTPKLAEALGIHFIHQDRLLPPSFSVGEALFLGDEPVYGGLQLLNRSGMRREAARLLKSYFDLELPDGALIADLTTAEKQIIQITRALIRKPKILVFDEPTAALVRREADILFGLIRRLAGEGVTILYISHYLREIEEICDAVTVLRNGRDVATLSLSDTSAAEIGQLMVAREAGDLFPPRHSAIGTDYLRVRDLALDRKFEPLSFTLRRGEILGLTGLLGSGAKDLMRVLFGLEAATSGEIVIGERKLRFDTPRQAARARIALVPEDRRRHGVALEMTVQENTTLANLGRFLRFGRLDPRAEENATQELIRKLQIKTSGPRALVRSLSGGNQQKVAIAKWLGRDTELYLLDEPTVGVDIGAKAEIYSLIADLAAQGASIILLSSDLDELVGLADRVLVMFRGRITCELLSSHTTATEILAEATGAPERSRHVG